MAQLTINDVLSSNILDGVAQFSITDMIICMALALAIGLFILFVYKKCFSGVMYSSGFAISLIAMTLITAMIILAIGSNIILSLGMVGALSIVRFRSAVKDPMDIAYLFWSISVGIVLGAGMLLLAVFGSLFIGIVLYIFSIKKPSHKPYILIVNCKNEVVEKQISSILDANIRKKVLRSKTITEDGIELTIEVRLTGQESKFINSISAVNGVNRAVLVSYNGEYMT